MQTGFLENLFSIKKGGSIRFFQRIVPESKRLMLLDHPSENTFREYFRHTIPDIQIQWKDVWIGAALTSILFTIGKFLIGLYLGSGGVTSPYGAAGSVITVLLWVYYSALIFLLGAEFTKSYSDAFGSGVVPAENAEISQEQAKRERSSETPEKRIA